MSNRTKWIVVAAVLIAVVLVCCLLLVLLAAGLGLFNAGTDFRGPVMHRDWMEGMCPGCGGFSVGNVLLGLLLLGVLAGVVILVVLAIVWLARAGGRREGPPAEPQ